MSNVLIIDDSDFDRRMIQRAISAIRDDVVFSELPGGYGAIDVMKRHRPDLLILDIRMPGMDGFKVLEDIRKTPALEGQVVIMVSGSSEQRDRELAQQYGADGYFVKPPTALDYFALGKQICGTFM